MWTLEHSPEFEKRLKRFRKKRPKELTAVLTNLDRYLKSLNLGSKPKQIQGGWIHPEPRDIVALSQQGAGIKGSLAEARLYVWPDNQTKVLHVITLGEKSTQSDDIKLSTDYVQEIEKERSDQPEASSSNRK